MENRRSPFTSEPQQTKQPEQKEMQKENGDTSPKSPPERIRQRFAYWEGDPVPIVFHSDKGWHPTDEPYDGGYY